MTQHRDAELKIEGFAPIPLRVVQGTEGCLAIDVSDLYRKHGVLTCDPGYMSTGSCYSSISYIDGERGILRYRGYNIYDLAVANVDYVATAWLLIHGNLPSLEERLYFRDLLTTQEILHEGMLKFFDSLPPYGDPMPILSAAVQCSSLSTIRRCGYRPRDTDAFMTAAAKLISKVRTIAAFSYKKSIGMPFEYPDPALDYCSNFFHMMFSLPYRRYEAPPLFVEALNLFLILHADHEQNCSTSTVRMVGSSRANLFDSVSAGISALSGPLHGGANRQVIHMLREVYEGRISVGELVASPRRRAPAPASRIRPPHLQGLRPPGHGAETVRGPPHGRAERIGPPPGHRQGGGGDRPSGQLFRGKGPVPQHRFLFGDPPADDGYRRDHVHGDVRHRPHGRLDRPLAGRGPPGRCTDSATPPDLHGLQERPVPETGVSLRSGRIPRV